MAGRRLVVACLCLASLCAQLAISGSVLAQPPAAHTEDLTELTLEELLNIRVIGVDTDLRLLTGEAAAIHVITGEQIRRSGYRSIPEILRLVPGMNVARTNANDWSVSARGMNGEFADKLEVLLDGRRLQTPLFLGVQWQLQHTFLADIDRIEVIRGPGGALWGTNAVNGVINIITRSARHTQGHYAEFGAGNEQKSFVDYRYGGTTENDLHYRYWLSYWDRDAVDQLGGGEAMDGHQWQQVGFRLDWGDPQRDLFNFQGDSYYNATKTIDTIHVPGDNSPQQDSVTDRFYGANLVFRWSRKLHEHSNIQLSSYYDFLVRDTPLLGDRRHSFDLTLKHNFKWGDRHYITWGGGYRVSSDEVDNSFTVRVDPGDETLHAWQLFFQDQIILRPEKLALTLGSKFEHNDFTGLESQPSIRLMYKPHEDHALWAAITRAVRVPSRLDTGVRFTGATICGDGGPLQRDDPDNPCPAAAQAGFGAVFGNPDFKSIELLAWELGYRGPLSEWIDVNLALFYNQYDKLRTFTAGAPVVEDGNTFFPLNTGNLNKGKSWGGELAVSMRPRSDLTLQAGYSILRLDIDEHPDVVPNDINVGENEDPERQWFISANWNLPGNMQVDGMLRHVDDLKGVSFAVDDYTELDLRWAWQFRPQWTVALVGKNLLNSSHQEFESEIFGGRNLIERSVFLQLVWEPD